MDEKQSFFKKHQNLMRIITVLGTIRSKGINSNIHILVIVCKVSTFILVCRVTWKASSAMCELKNSLLSQSLFVPSIRLTAEVVL